MSNEWTLTDRVDRMGRPVRVKDPVASFWNKVQRLDSGCWVWTASVTPKGYGTCKTLGEHYAHRASWVIANGSIPDGQMVCHRCDNPPCVNPSHLFLGSAADNSQDMVSKGRAARNAGDKSGMAKVSDADVAEMRRLRNLGVRLADLAVEFGIHPSQVSRIVRGVSRGNVVEFTVTEDEVA